MKQLFINIVGHNASGKTTLANKLTSDFQFSKVNGDEFRDFVSNHVHYFKDLDISYPNERYSELNPLVIQYRFELTDILLAAGQSVIYDGSGSTKAHRARYLDKIAEHFPTIKRVLIWIDVPEDELLARLTKRGESWVKLYTDIKKQDFELPEPSEAEMVICYNQQNYEEIRETLTKLLAED